MYARSTTIRGKPESIDAAIAFIRDEVMPTITAHEGCVGLSLVVDRETGRGIATSSWLDAAAMHASDEAMMPLRVRGGEILGGAPQVEEWEVAHMHRDHATHDGSRCRVTWSRIQDVDAGIDLWRSTLLPQIEQLEGFCSASLLVDRAGGRGCSTVTFDSQETMASSRQPGAAIREMAMAMGIGIDEVAEMELAIAHLRLPELV